MAIKCDVTIPEEIGAAIDATVAQLGRLDILVNNAGATEGGAVFPMQITDEIWDAVYDTNLRAPLRFAQAAHDSLADSGHGSIINVASIAAKSGQPFNATYASSKAALVTLTESLAGSFAGDGIRVNAVLPGWVETDMTTVAQDDETIYRRIIARIPMRRFGRPDEFGGVATFLASDASSFMTGQSVVVDGGRVLG